MEKLKNLLQEALNDEWKAFVIYTMQAARLRGLFKDTIGDHLADHAADENGHAEQLVQHMLSHGFEPKLEIPEFTVETELEKMLQQDIEDEMKAIDLYDEIIKYCEDRPEIKDTRILVEDILLKEIEHQDEIAAWLESTASERASEVKEACSRHNKARLLKRIIE